MQVVARSENKYEWKPRPGHSFKGDAQVIGEHIEELIDQRHGRLTPDDIVEDARNPLSPLHPSFEWDDAAAAVEQRRNTARSLMQSIVVVRIEDQEVENPIRAFVNVISDEKQHYYTPIRVAMNDLTLREQLKQQAWRELQSWRKKYEDILEFAQVIDAINGIALPLAA